MTAALILLAAIVGVGAVLYLLHRFHNPTTDAAASDDAPAAPAAEGEECCGMHITCEKDSLLAAVSERVEYYDDEELDRFAGWDPENYTESETEEFRDILLSMRPEDIAGWARSLQLRNIALPGIVREELLLIVSEARKGHHNASIYTI